MKSKFAVIAFLLGVPFSAIAAEVSIQVPTTQTVTAPPVALRVDRNLSFPSAQEGSDAVTIAPTASNAAEIAIVNGRGRFATISVTESSINLDDGNGNTIAVGSFVGSPALGNITLPSSGEQKVNVGATRAALTTQPAGDYQGSFTFKVVY